MTMRLLDYIHRDDGTAAVEFALVVLPFVSLIMASLSLGVLLWTNTTLHYATEDAARCASVKTDTVCTDSASIISYAQSRYQGPNVSPVFAYSATGCGHTVTATASYSLNTGLINLTVPLSTSACFP